MTNSDRTMSGDEVRALFARGRCPGCDAPLAKVAGVGNRHWRGGQAVAASSGSDDGRIVVQRRQQSHGVQVKPRLVATRAGDQARDSQPDDNRLCLWDADMLAGLVHVGIGKVAMP